MLSLGPAALAWVSGLAPYGYHLQFPSLLKGADRGQRGQTFKWRWPCEQLGVGPGRGAMKELSGGC